VPTVDNYLLSEHVISWSSQQPTNALDKKIYVLYIKDPYIRFDKKFSSSEGSPQKGL
jgi:hypothetical protein